ncbi:helix-turn-helix domain-containing protein [Dyella humicola]|uniref:helix-turn-helix domain-containing protein n=1 Tax=Dyella humicola TaxID=2992126 RepID=UPI00225BD3BE|nr:helix-turn-helix transcriptional regulator [Dyella humicola]
MEEPTAQMKLAGAIRRRREALEFSQESFADAIGMHRAQYGKVERGLVNMSIQTLSRVATGLGMSVATLAKSAKI